MSRFTPIFILCFIFGLWACEKPDNENPIAEFDIQPRFGDSLTVFHFDASPASDNKTINFRLKVRWDIYDDGKWDSDFSINKSFAFRFPENGLYNIRCEVLDVSGNSSTSIHQVQVAPVPRDSIFTDSRDGKKYKAVFLFDRWWMSQNLNYGTTLESSEKGTDNSVPEKFMHPNTSYDSLFGGFYTWHEATDYKRDIINGICPEGWRLPIQEDIKSISKVLWFTDDYSEYVLNDGSFGLDLSLSGRYVHTAKIWDSQHFLGHLWINQPPVLPRFNTWLMYNNRTGLPVIYTDYNPFSATPNLWQDSWGSFTFDKIALPIRCVKDHEAK